MTMGKISTFKPPSSAAPDTSSGTSYAMPCATSCVLRPILLHVLFLHVSPKGRPRAPNVKARKM